ncbi:MAG: fatty acid desaturase, partial [Variovorax sp.]
MPRLRNARDWQSLAYLAALPALMAWQWVNGFS